MGQGTRDKGQGTRGKEVISFFMEWVGVGRSFLGDLVLV